MPPDFSNLNSPYIRSPRELPPDSLFFIYGAGGRGTSLARRIRAEGGGRRVAGFLDTFKNGRAGGLPVFAIDSLSEATSGLDAGSFTIVIASAFHRAIAKGLRERGVTDYRVLLDSAESIPCAELPEDEVVNALNASRNPIARPIADTRVIPGRVWRCSSLSGLYLRPTGLSLCCWMQDLADGLPEEAVPRVNRLRKRIVEAIDAGNCTFCAACPELQPASADSTSDLISLLHMDISTTCNLKCAYCNATGTHKGCSYDPALVLDELRGRKLLSPAYAFDWGGFGEPTINPHFAPITRIMIEDGASGLVYTNALVRSEVIAEGLRLGRLQITCSIDAGTRETYHEVRGVDAFEIVWQNLAAYISLNPDMVILKYIVTPDNASPLETDAFVDRCMRAGARHVLIAKDFFSKRTPALVREGVRNLALACGKAGLPYSFLLTAISPAFIRSLKLKTPSSKMKA